MSDEEEEPVDLKPEIEEHCKHSHCAESFKAYEACAQRVQDKGDGHCTGYYFEYLHCIDHCAANKIFAQAK